MGVVLCFMPGKNVPKFVFSLVDRYVSLSCLSSRSIITLAIIYCNLGLLLPF